MHMIVAVRKLFNESSADSKIEQLIKDWERKGLRVEEVKCYSISGTEQQLNEAPYLQLHESKKINWLRKFLGLNQKWEQNQTPREIKISVVPIMRIGDSVNDKGEEQI